MSSVILSIPVFQFPLVNSTLTIFKPKSWNGCYIRTSPHLVFFSASQVLLCFLKNIGNPHISRRGIASRIRTRGCWAIFLIPTWWCDWATRSSPRGPRLGKEWNPEGHGESVHFEGVLSSGVISRWWNFKYFLNVHPSFGEMIQFGGNHPIWGILSGVFVCFFGVESNLSP